VTTGEISRVLEAADDWPEWVDDRCYLPPWKDAGFLSGGRTRSNADGSCAQHVVDVLYIDRTVRQLS
jgi:hypothetical protein